MTIPGADRRPPPAPLLRRVDREPRAARLPAARARTSSASAVPSRWPGPTATSSRPGCGSRRRATSCSSVIGGRPVHPVNVRVGGFYRVPARRELRALLPNLEQARDIAEDTVRWVAGFDFPDFEQDYQFVALEDPGHYPLLGRRLVSNRGLVDRPRRVRPARRGVPRRALHRAARPPGGWRPLLRRPHGPLRARLRAALARDPSAGAGDGLRTPVPQPVPQHRRPRPRGAPRVRERARASSSATSAPMSPSSTSNPAPGPGSGAPRRPAASSCTPTRSTTTA